ncbi:dihydrofolate reductase-like domain-containing protein [Schizophyllum fasciatum]
MSRLTLIVAATKSNGIGQNGNLPWHLPKEMAYFAKVTSAAPEGRVNRVIMGRKTWESIPAKFRPLRDRLNVVLSHRAEYEQCVAPTMTHYARLQGTYRPGADVFSDLNAALNTQTSARTHRTYIIGGATLYEETLNLSPSETGPFVDRILITRVLDPAFNECDAYFPDIAVCEEWRQAPHDELEGWLGFDVPRGVQEEKGVKYEFQMWVR